MMTRNCPCCGAPVAAPTPLDDALRAARLSARQVELVRLIARWPGKSAPELADLLYRDAADGGPDYATEVVRVQLHFARKRLAETPLRIVCGMGSRSGYRLEGIEGLRHG